jgi:hypothetical protein
MSKILIHLASSSKERRYITRDFGPSLVRKTNVVKVELTKI